MINSGNQINHEKKSYSAVNVSLISAVLLAVLYFGKTLFIPLSIAVLISFLIYPVSAWLEKKGFKKVMAIVFSVSLLALLAAALVYLLIIQFINFYSEWDALSVKLAETGERLDVFLESKLDISIEDQHNWVKNFIDNSGTSVIPFLKDTTYSVSIVIVFLALIPILAGLILYYRRLLLRALIIVFPEKDGEVRKILQETVHAYYSFVTGMLMVYVIVGILNSAGLAIIGIPHPVLFGFIASVLTIIPYVGIIVASLLPISVAWITYNSVWQPLGVVLVFTIVQFLEANVIFPFAVSNRLKINALAVIITIIAGGVLWGAAGMILFIPFIGILKLIADKSEKLKLISVLLGTGNGEEKK